MPDPVVAEPPQTVVPPVAPPAGDNPPSNEIDPRVPGLMRRLFDTVEDEPKKTVEPKDDKPKTEPKPPADKAPPAADGKPAAQPAAEPTDTPLRVRKQKVVRPELPIDAPAAPKADLPAAGKDIDPNWEAGLDDEKKEILADARDAEKQFPHHKGLAARTAKFLKEDAAQRAATDFDNQSPEYRAWLDKNQPKLTRTEIRELEKTRAINFAREGLGGEITDLKHRLFVQNNEPKIEAEARQIFNQLSHTALPDEIAAAIKKDGYDKASETYRLELETAQEVLTTVADDLKEFKKLSTKDPETGRPMAAEATDPSDPRYAQHQRLNLMVTNVCENFKNNAPADQQLRNGKWFVTRDEWHSIRPEQRHRFWTFSNSELATVAQQAVKHVVATKITEKRGTFSRYGWQPPVAKTPPAAPPKPNEPPQPTNSPRTPAPAAVPNGSDPLSDIDARATRLFAQLTRSE